MLVRYYDNPELAYTSRKRYNTFNFEPFSEEEQKSVLFGDGAKTSLKTKTSNICKYVTIDDTRWFVVNYVYLNGGQVRLNLQRDVIGEFGISNCFGKIERGYTNSILKNRKELGLNQILKERKKLIPETNIYGNYTVNNHNNEIWGIMYLTKPSEGQVTIPIPAFKPQTTDFDFIENNTKKNKSVSGSFSFDISVNVKPVDKNFICGVSVYADGYNIDVEDINIQYADYAVPTISLYFDNNINSFTNSEIIEVLKNVMIRMVQTFLFGYNDNSYFTIPSKPSVDTDIKDYNDITIYYEEKYYRYSMSESNNPVYGSSRDNSQLKTFFEDEIANNVYNANSSGTKYSECTRVEVLDSYTGIVYDFSCQWNVTVVTYNYTILTGVDAGELVIDVNNEDLVNEPYYILVFPLFDVTISGNSEVYNIDSDEAWNIWNTVILTLSGENGYLVDAQIYPYCPVLTGVTAEIQGYPFFHINSTAYTLNCRTQLLPLSDVKKEYIERSYSIISPEQSSKYTFNFYDYVKTINDNNGKNYAYLNIQIKTALKPFAIIASAVITPEEGTLMNKTYESDLRGSQPSSNGFECSLASNAFETYKRQNSNYQQIFNLQQEQLQKEHSVELVNDITSTVINTARSSAFGAIAGASMADAGLLSSILPTKSVGAIAGAASFGAVTGAAMSAQTVANESLRDYEEYIQQANFDLEIGTIKNLPNSVNRISSFNEIILKDFWFIIEVYECSDYEKTVVDNYINNYAYGIGVFDYFVNYQKYGWFLKGSVITSSFDMNLHVIASKELTAGIYYYE